MDLHYHTVLYRFADDTAQDAIDDVLAQLHSLVAIPAVRSIAVGPNCLPVTDGWTHGMTIVFDSEASMMQDFGPHPLHQEVFRSTAAVFDRYMAMDISSGPDEKGSGDDDEAGR